MGPALVTPQCQHACAAPGRGIGGGWGNLGLFFPPSFCPEGQMLLPAAAELGMG